MKEMTSPHLPITEHSAPLLADYLRRAAKPRADWKCGLEVELFGYTGTTHARLTGDEVQAVLESFAHVEDRLYFERDTVPVELCVDNLGHLTVEPGGQIEFSGKARANLSEAEADLAQFLARLRTIAEQRQLILLATGFDPLRSIHEQHWFPKMRYELMRPFLAARGARAWDMMTRTCALQVSLDFESEDDWAKKFILGNRLAPIVTAMFANSPFAEGKLSGYKSTRAAAWLATDDARSGLSPLAIADHAAFADYVDYVQRVPMIFARRNEAYRDAVSGMAFGDYLSGGAAELTPIFQDWTDHLTTIFTDARLKQYVEFRSADGGSAEYALALAALWKGLLYDRAALADAWKIAPALDAGAARRLREQVARDGLAVHTPEVNVLALAQEIVRLAADGLQRNSPDEVHYLDVLRQTIIVEEMSPADMLLRNWHGSWHGSIAKAVEYLRV